eukprot:13214018-Ditylum_brightwellii.AAC.1
MKVNGDEFYCVFLYGKWFYTTNRRRRIKFLPPGQGKDPASVLLKHPKMISRQHPVKVMYLGVVASPNDEKGFGRKVLMKQVCKRKGTDVITSAFLTKDRSIQY